MCMIGSCSFSVSPKQLKVLEWLSFSPELNLWGQQEKVVDKQYPHTDRFGEPLEGKVNKYFSVKIGCCRILSNYVNTYATRLPPLTCILYFFHLDLFCSDG